jgi:hypothetical protein
MNNPSPSTSAPATAFEGVDLFPYTIVRIGGGSFDDLVAMEVDPGGDLLSEIRAVRRELQTASAILGEEIFSAIGGCTDGAIRRSLLRAKRDLFNGRGNAVDILGGLAGRPLPGLARYELTANALDACHSALERVFTKRQTRARNLLQDLAAGEAFRKPLMLSSRTLLDELHIYTRERSYPLSAKQLHIERAVVKYVTRSQTKTSPFSTFGRLALARSTNLARNVWDFDDSLEFTSQIRISSLNWLKLRPLILAIREIADHLGVRANPTLQRSDEGHKYLRGVRNIESFQTLPPFDELTQIADFARDSPPFGKLLNRVLDAGAVEGDKDDVRIFLDKLIAEGFLEFDIGISGTDSDWDLLLASLLRPIAPRCTAASEIIDVLSDIRERLQEFALAGFAERDEIVTRCHARMSELMEHLSAASSSRQDGEPPPATAERDPAKAAHGPTFEQQHFLYEDSAIPKPAIQINALDLDPIVDSLAILSRHLAFSGRGDERTQLTHYCVAKYGEGVVPLIRIYEDYYRDCKVPEQLQKQSSKAEGLDEPLDYPGAASFRETTAARARMLTSWVTSIADRVRSDGRVSGAQVDLTSDDLVAASSLAPARHARLPTSGSAYLQLVLPSTGRSHCQGVVNGLLPGNGKMMSRFLDMFPGEVAELIRIQNRKEAGSVRLAEVRDGSVSNANMHPPLLDFEISSPGAQSSFPPEKQIPISDLYVAISDDTETPLALIQHSTGKHVEVLDLGFLGLGFRSQLLQLLVYGFSRARFGALQSLLHAAGTAAVAGSSGPALPPNAVSAHPRVVFDDRLILRRRSWVVARKSIPIRQPGESDATFYLRINDWRESNGIPAHVFVFLTRDRGAGRKRETKLSRDDYKPQFISFHNWFTVDLFDRMRSRAMESIFLEEMLPSASSMLQIAGRPHPSELIVQWSQRVL